MTAKQKEKVFKKNAKELFKEQGHCLKCGDRGKFVSLVLICVNGCGAIFG
jgi:hypothetical protein